MNRDERELTIDKLNLVGGISWEVTPTGTQIHWAGDGCVYTMSSSGAFSQRC